MAQTEWVSVQEENVLVCIAQTEQVVAEDESVLRRPNGRAREERAWHKLNGSRSKRIACRPRNAYKMIDEPK